MDILPTDGAGAPARWFVIFRRRVDSRLVRWLAFGRYKHVRAAGYVPETDCWLFYDHGWNGISVFLARGRGAEVLLAHWTEAADVLAIAARAPLPSALPRLCTTAVASLIGLPSCALRPDALYRDCLAYGAMRICDQQSPTPEPSPCSASPVSLTV